MNSCHGITPPRCEKNTAYDEGKTLQHMYHEGLAMGDPAEPLARHIRPLLFKRLQVFFCAPAQAGEASARPMNDGQQSSSHLPTAPPFHPM